MFFKWFFKAWVAVYLVTHTFTITMAVFDMAQHVVSGAAGVIGGDTNIDVDAALSSMQAGLDAMEIPELLLLVMETSLVSLCMKIMSVLITVILYGRMIEIYLYCSVSPIPFATMTNREWGQIAALRRRFKICSKCLCRFCSRDAGQLDLHAEALIFNPNHRSGSFGLSPFVCGGVRFSGS